MKLAIIIVSLLVLDGCSTGKSLPSEYFSLSPDFNAKVIGGADSENLLIAVLGVKIPAYLDRPQLVERAADSQLTMFEYKRWAGNLKDELQRVLAENISYQLNNRAVVTQPWHRSVKPDYLVQLDVHQFEKNAGGQLQISVQWQIMSGTGRELLAITSFRTTLQVQQQDTNSTVQAQNVAMADIAAKIVEEIKRLLLVPM